jgi:hypothetical protein
MEAVRKRNGTEGASFLLSLPPMPSTTLLHLSVLAVSCVLSTRRLSPVTTPHYYRNEVRHEPLGPSRISTGKSQLPAYTRMLVNIPYCRCAYFLPYGCAMSIHPDSIPFPFTCMVTVVSSLFLLSQLSLLTATLLLLFHSFSQIKNTLRDCFTARFLFSMFFVLAVLRFFSFRGILHHLVEDQQLL